METARIDASGRDFSCGEVVAWKLGDLRGVVFRPCYWSSLFHFRYLRVLIISCISFGLR